MKPKDTIPLLDLAGTGYEIGCGHGEALRDQIKEFFATAWDVHAANLAVKTDQEGLIAFCHRNAGFLKKYSPELMEELKGVAAGSGLSVENLVFLNSFLEMEDLRPPGLGGQLLSDRLWGCTTFNVLPKAGKDGKPYLGQTFDMEQYYSKFNVILRIKPKQGPEVLTYTFAGILGLNGMNSRGVGLVINKVVANDARQGVIYPFVARKALMQERIGDSLGAAIFASRASGVVYQLASADGVAFCAETSAGYYELLPFEEVIAHTNHYVAPSMRRYETPNWLSHGGSYVRSQVANQRLKEAVGQIDPDFLMAMTRDHTNYPRCICTHGWEGEGELTAFTTVAAMVMDLREQAMWVCHENPCNHEYVKLSF